MAKEALTYEVHPDQKAWLEKMAASHNLPDASKALRCLLDYAMEDGSEGDIFGQIRCRHC